MQSVAPAEAIEPTSNQTVWVFAALSAALASGYGVLFTMGGDYRNEYGITASTFGLIIGLGFIMSFVAQFTIGPLGDRGYARKMVLGGAIVNAAGMLLMGFGTTAEVLLFGRVLSGLAIGAASPAIKRMVVVGSGENLGRNLGRLFSADVFGFAVGPVISGILVGPFGIPAPFIVIACVTVAMVLVSLRFDIEESGQSEPQRFALDLLKHRAFAGAVLLGVAAYVMIGAFDALWDLVHTDLGTSELMANIGISLFAIPLVLLGPTSGKLAQRVGPFLTAAVGMSLAAVFFGIYGVLSVGGAIFAVTMVHAVTDGLSFAASGVAVGMTAPESRQAGAQGVLGGMQSLGAGIMAPVTGWLYETQGQQTAYWVAAATIFTLVVLGLLLAGPAVRLRG